MCLNACRILNNSPVCTLQNEDIVNEYIGDSEVVTAHPTPVSFFDASVYNIKSC